MHQHRSIKTKMKFSIPTEITAEILSRLPVLTLVQCKSVSKTWQAIINNPIFVDNYTIQHEEEKGFLFYTKNFNSNSIFHYGEYNNKDTSFNSYELLINQHDLAKETYFIGSCKGLIYLCSWESSDIRICNPFTDECMNLPKLINDGDINQYKAAGFGYHPITKQYQMVAVYFNRIESTEQVVYVYTLGDKQWRKKLETRRLLYSVKAQGAHVNGALYWTNMLAEIIMFDLATEELRMVPSPPQLKANLESGYDSNEVELRVLGGSLCMVEQNYSYNCTYIYVMNSKDNSWTKTSSIIQWKEPSRPKPVALSIHGNIWLDCTSDHRTFELYDVKTKNLHSIKNKENIEDWPLHTAIVPFTKSLVSLKVLFAEEDGHGKENKHTMVQAARVN